MNKLITGAIVMTTAIAANAVELMQDWDKTFPKSDKVEHAKATFRNRFGITIAADVYKPMAGNGEWGTGNGRAVCPHTAEIGRAAIHCRRLRPLAGFIPNRLVHGRHVDEDCRYARTRRLDVGY